MLTTKNRARVFEIIFATLMAVLLVGCMPPGPKALLEGDKLLQDGRYAEAITALNEAVNALPQDSQKAQAWNRLGLAYQYTSDFTKAAQAYQQALKLDRNLIDARFNLGSLQMEQGNASGAIEAFTTCATLQPQNGDAWLKLSEAQLRRALQVSSTRERNQQLDAARKNAEQASKLKPSADALNVVGMVAFEKGRSADAIRSLQSALQIKPDFGPAIFNLAVVHHASRDVNERRLALKYYRDYLATAPLNASEVEVITRQLEAELNAPHTPVAVNNAATNKVETPRIISSGNSTAAKAPARYKYSSPLRPAAGNRNDANRFFSAAIEAQKAKKLDEAADNYRKAIQADPSFFEAHYNLELVEFERGNLSTALNEAEMALVTGSGSVNARYNFALALDKAGYAQDAVNELEKLLSQNPDETRAHLFLGSLYAQKLNDMAKARMHFTKVLELEPQHAQAAAIRNWLAKNQ